MPRMKFFLVAILGPTVTSMNWACYLHEFLTGRLPPTVLQRLGGSEWQLGELPEPWSRRLRDALAIPPKDRPQDVVQWWNGGNGSFQVSSFANVLISPNGALVPAPGFLWVTDEPGDFRVREELQFQASECPLANSPRCFRRVGERDPDLEDCRPEEWHEEQTHVSQIEPFPNVVRQLDGSLVPEFGFVWNNDSPDDFTVAPSPERKIRERGLVWAAARGKVHIVSSLLEGGMNLDCENKEGYTPLQRASEEGQDSTVSLLPESGADPDYVNDPGSALMLAAENGHFSTVSLLLESGADPNYMNDAGSALMQAAENGYLRTVKRLLDAGADVDMESDIGDTALVLAAARGYKDIVVLLLNAGADVNHGAEDGCASAAVLAAAENGHLGVAPIPLMIRRSNSRRFVWECSRSGCFERL